MDKNKTPRVYTRDLTHNEWELLYFIFNYSFQSRLCDALFCNISLLYKFQNFLSLNYGTLYDPFPHSFYDCARSHARARRLWWLRLQIIRTKSVRYEVRPWVCDYAVWDCNTRQFITNPTGQAEAYRQLKTINERGTND